MAAEKLRTPVGDGVAPESVPHRRLHTGASMPAIGLGTFGSDHATPEQVAEAVRGAIHVGYRHLDCASVYGNEDRIGRVLRELFRSGAPREQVWITSKLWNDKHAEDDGIPSCRKSIEDLQCGCLDTYLV